MRSASYGTGFEAPRVRASSPAAPRSTAAINCSRWNFPPYARDSRWNRTSSPSAILLQSSTIGFGTILDRAKKGPSFLLQQSADFGYHSVQRLRLRGRARLAEFLERQP